MSKGAASIIVVVLLLVMSVGLAGGFWFWSQSSSGDLKQTAEEAINQEVGRERSSISVPVVVNEEGVTKVVVQNTGSVGLNPTLFETFVNSTLRENTPETIETLAPGDSVILELSGPQILACNRVRVTGQYETTEEYVYKDEGNC